MLSAFVYKCFLPGPTERLEEIRFFGKMSDLLYNIFPLAIYSYFLQPRSRAWVGGWYSAGCINFFDKGSACTRVDHDINDMNCD